MRIGGYRGALSCLEIPLCTPTNAVRAVYTISGELVATKFVVASSPMAAWLAWNQTNLQANEVIRQKSCATSPLNIL